jgi:hypothetical protein
MRRLLALLAACLLLPATAHALEGEALVRGLNRNGVRIRYNAGRCSAPGLLGSYSHRLRLITLCAAKMRSSRQLYEVLAHEAIHAVQHCRGVETLAPIGEIARLATDADFNQLHLYTPRERAAELEANVLSRASEDVLVQLVDASCKP